jgi:hypothetical protein
MTIADTTPQDKVPLGGWAGKIPKILLVIIAILLANTAGMGIGYLLAKESGAKQDQLWIEQLPAIEQANGALTATTTPKTTKARPQAPETTQTAAAAAAVPNTHATGEVIASKTGTVYYLPVCSGANRILPENRVTFASSAAAEAKGLKLAKNCNGFK